jgi:hypothetical protein
MSARPGYGTRFDAFTPNAIDRARECAPGAGLYKKMGAAFCAGCQQDRSTKGGTRRSGIFVCESCLSKRKVSP